MRGYCANGNLTQRHLLGVISRAYAAATADIISNGDSQTSTDPSVHNATVPEIFGIPSLIVSLGSIWVPISHEQMPSKSSGFQER